jgi:hypothetical protein
MKYWRPRRDSNPQPTDSKSAALSFELRGRAHLGLNQNVPGTTGGQCKDRTSRDYNPVNILSIVEDENQENNLVFMAFLFNGYFWRSFIRLFISIIIYVIVK